MDGGGEGCKGVRDKGEEEGEGGVHCIDFSMRLKGFGWAVGFVSSRLIWHAAWLVLQRCYD